MTAKKNDEFFSKWRIILAEVFTDKIWYRDRYRDRLKIFALKFAGIKSWFIKLNQPAIPGYTYITSRGKHRKNNSGIKIFFPLYYVIPMV